MTLPKLISLYSSAPQCGKSTVAEHLALQYGYVRFSFARPLKQMLRALLLSARMPLPEIEERLYGSLKEAPIKELGNVSARYLAQTLGTEWGREAVYENLWVDTMRARLERHFAEGGRAVIDDMRFPNELRLVEELGGAATLVLRPGVGRNTSHASEGALDGAAVWAAAIVNDGSLADLHDAIAHALSNMAEMIRE